MSGAKTMVWDEIREQLLSDPTVKAEYELLAGEFSLAGRLIALRKATGKSQREFAQMVGMKQPQLARLESGQQVPKLDTLRKIAAGAGYTVELHFVPGEPKSLPEVVPFVT
jgi:DNA-binding XRE family transcriptional regulator